MSSSPTSKRRSSSSPLRPLGAPATPTETVRRKSASPVRINLPFLNGDGKVSVKMHQADVFRMSMEMGVGLC